MADSEVYHASAVAGERSTFGALVNWAGALVSLGLVLGMAVWAVQLTLRDVSGVPVIQAIEGPMRVPPADPGGLQAPHQGLAVNRIAEGQEAQPVPDRLVLAPPPVELQEVRFETAEEEAVAEASARLPVAAPAEDPEVAADTTAAAAPTETMALIDRLLAEAQGLSPEEVPARTAPETVAAPGPQVIPASVPGVAVSPRPAARPVELVSASSSSRPEPQPETVELSPSELPEGTRLVQLGAFDNAQIARGEWARLATEYPDYFAGRPRVVERVDSGGQTFYRLRAGGFEDLAGARRFCSVLVAEGAACIPVTLR